MKKWIEIADGVTVELSSVRSVTIGESTYLYVKYTGERKPTGYPMKNKENQKTAYAKLRDALTEFCT